MSALYGLRWEHIEVMPKAELDQYMAQFREIRDAAIARLAT